jgi:hypothetical protein
MAQEAFEAYSEEKTHRQVLPGQSKRDLNVTDFVGLQAFEF